MLSLLRQPNLSLEDVKDYRYSTVSGIFMPASKILIGTGGSISDAALYESGDLNFDFTNGVGENGLDTGAEAANQWYALYAVPKAGTKQYTLRASIQAPIQSGGTGPTGFPKHRYLGIFRNGTNTYSSLSSHTPNDITLFTKTKNVMNFTGYNDTNGGQYPQATRHNGVTLFVANTAVNGVLLDTSNNSYVGFSGISPAASAKLPYRVGIFGFKHYINSVTNTALLSVTDFGGNDRSLYAMPLETVVNSFNIYVELQFSLIDWHVALRSVHAANPNVNRGLLLQKFIDPFTVGGI
jgi:hypothetical protein